MTKKEAFVLEQFKYVLWTVESQHKAEVMIHNSLQIAPPANRRRQNGSFRLRHKCIKIRFAVHVDR